MNRVRVHCVLRWQTCRPRHAAAFTVALSLVTVSTSLGQRVGDRDATRWASTESISDRAARWALNLSDARVQSLTLPTPATPSLAVAVEVDGQPWTLVLRKHTIRSDDFKVLVQLGATGVLVAVTPPPVMTYRGRVLEVPEAVVSASIRDGLLHAVIHTPAGDYGIEPLLNARAMGGAAEHVVYRASDWVNVGGYACGTTVGHRVRAVGDSRAFVPRTGGQAVSGTRRADAIPVAGALGSEGGVGLTFATIGIDSDFEFYEKNGSDVASTVLDIETVMNSVATHFEVESVGIGHEISRIIVRTVPSGLYNFNIASALLCEFREAWNLSPHANIQRDVAHLFTGKVLAGSVIGFAYVGVVCNETGEMCGTPGSMAYALSESRFAGGSFERRVALTAHGLGHGWNATHCDETKDCRTMCSDLGGCTGELASFGPAATAEIVDFNSSRTCLVNVLDGLTAPFLDDFPTLELDPNLWTYVKGAQVGGGGIGEPSPPLALVLKAEGTGQFRHDEIRSNEILLGDASGARLTYHTQHRGVEIGESLVVEFRDDNLTWVEINRIVSDGNDQDAFVLHTHELLFDGLHDGFRVRFRAEVNEVNDTWFVDDVGVEPCETERFGDLDSSGIVDLLDIFCVLDGFAGLEPLCTSFEAIDVLPCGGGDGTIDLIDIVGILDAFSGSPGCPGACVTGK